MGPFINESAAPPVEFSTALVGATVMCRLNVGELICLATAGHSGALSALTGRASVVGRIHWTTHQ